MAETRSQSLVSVHTAAYQAASPFREELGTEISLAAGYGSGILRADPYVNSWQVIIGNNRQTAVCVVMQSVF